MSERSLRFLGPDDRALVDEAFERVFRPSFVPSELPDIDGIVPIEGRTVLVATDESGVLAGAVSETMTDISLLCYMAARPDARSLGLGAQLLVAIRERWSADGASLVVAEVRDPRVWPVTEDDRPADRLRFYERNGCYLLPVPWVQPSLDGEDREGGMLLLSAHGAGLGDPVDPASLTAWATAYYADAEDGEPNDPEYRALQARLSEPDLRVIEISDYPSVALL